MAGAPYFAPALAPWLAVVTGQAAAGENVTRNQGGRWTQRLRAGDGQGRLLRPPRGQCTQVRRYGVHVRRLVRLERAEVDGLRGDVDAGVAGCGLVDPCLPHGAPGDLAHLLDELCVSRADRPGLEFHPGLVRAEIRLDLAQFFADAYSFSRRIVGAATPNSVGELAVLSVGSVCLREAVAQTRPFLFPALAPGQGDIYRCGDQGRQDCRRQMRSDMTRSVERVRWAGRSGQERECDGDDQPGPG